MELKYEGEIVNLNYFTLSLQKFESKYLLDMMNQSPNWNLEFVSTEIIFYFIPIFIFIKNIHT